MPDRGRTAVRPYGHDGLVVSICALLVVGVTKDVHEKCCVADYGRECDPCARLSGRPTGEHRCAGLVAARTISSDPGVGLGRRAERGADRAGVGTDAAQGALGVLAAAARFAD